MVRSLHFPKSTTIWELNSSNPSAPFTAPIVPFLAPSGQFISMRTSPISMRSFVLSQLPSLTFTCCTAPTSYKIWCEFSSALAPRFDPRHASRPTPASPPGKFQRPNSSGLVDTTAATCTALNSSVLGQLQAAQRSALNQSINQRVVIGQQYNHSSAASAANQQKTRPSGKTKAASNDKQAAATPELIKQYSNSKPTINGRTNSTETRRCTQSSLPQPNCGGAEHPSRPIGIKSRKCPQLRNSIRESSKRCQNDGHLPRRRARSNLRDLIGTLTFQARLFRNKADKEERDAQIAHAQATQHTAQQQTTKTPSFTPPFYQFQPIQLDKFFGNKRKWPEFYESFKSAIGTHALSKAEKFNLLRNLLGGEARELVAGFRLEDNNYDTALQLLKDTYGAPDEHIRALHFELANLKPCKNLRDTKEFLLQLERLTRELNNSGEDIEGPPTFLMLEKKLTPGFLRTILTKKGENPARWNTTKFRDVLNEAVRKETQIQEVMGEYGHSQQQRPQPQKPNFSASKFRDRAPIPQQRERTFITSAVDDNHKRLHGRQPQYRPQQQRPRASQMQQRNSRTFNNRTQFPTQQANATFNQRKPPSPCIFCGNDHWNEECRKFSTIQQRREVLRTKALCFKCLKSNHQAGNCPQPKRCFKCKQPHPTALCHGDSKPPNQITAAMFGQPQQNVPSTQAQPSGKQRTRSNGITNVQCRKRKRHSRTADDRNVNGLQSSTTASQHDCGNFR
ncbi:hypothetical protein niasHS_000051 [Heterodera schachtii]|uniref:CCHC-type domain-containing protein n=1 Tax=Heterodera schachtii TaxID=97005 RepID=A0ABD2KMW0_HETSC